jgi:hypothetical protein
MSKAEELAEAIRTGHAQGIDAGLAAPGPFVADEIELAHEPPHPADGRRSGAEMAEMWGKEGSMLRSAMPDASLTEIVVAAHGEDEVRFDAILQGTTPDGASLAHQFRVVYTLSGGQIIRAMASYDPAPVAALNAKAFQAVAGQPSERA